MNNVLIIGAGYVGTKLFSFANKNNSNYFIYSREKLDYGDRSALGKFLLNNGITHVINCSGFTGRPNVDEGELKKKECWDLNVVIPLRVSKLCKELRINYIHISSGCIYSGYEKEFTEEDEPNFGLYDHSSFYSKSKHAFETLNDYGCTIRVRMPFCDDYHERSFITKIYKYDNLINYRNSKTYISDLCSFIEYIIDKNISADDIGIINFVNPDAQDTKYLVDRMKVFGVENKNWKIVEIEDIDIKAPRSNCVLSMDKFACLFPDFHVESEKEAIDLALTNMTFPKC
jgi:dTDP-4-dehydrorhamnose reductase